MSTFLRGKCACGRARLVLETPTLMLSHCHCRDCRAVHGAAFVTWTAVPRDRLTIVGELGTFVSSPGTERAFCKYCGTHVRYLSAQMPDRAYVPAGVLEEPLDRDPDCHVNVREKVSWHVIGDSLPRFEGFD